MARLLIVEPEEYFRTLLDGALAQAGYVAVEAANSYEVLPTAGLADVMKDIREPSLVRLLIIEAEVQFLTFFREVLEQDGYVVTETVHSYEVLPAADLADVTMDIQYLVVY